MAIIANILIIIKGFIFLIVHNIIWLHLTLIALSVFLLVWYYQRKTSSKGIITITRAIDYKIDSLFDLYVSFIVLLLYGISFILGIFILRILNIGKDLDLRIIYGNIYMFYTSHTILYFITCVISIICMLIWGLLLLKYIHKTVRFHANKLHILFSDSSKKSTPYNKVPTFALYNDSIMSTTLYEFLRKLRLLPEKSSNKVFVKLLSLEENLSLVIFIIGFTYDIIFNNMTLHYIFYLLPFILIYKLYRNILHFYNSRLYFDNYDCAVYALLYIGCLKSITEEEITLISVEEYIQRDFKPESIEI